MQIRRFYLPELATTDTVATLPPQEANHALRVLRLGEGDRLQLLNGRGLVADAELMPLGDKRRPKEASCRILTIHETPPPVPALTLFVAPPRGKAYDLVLRAAVELGFAAIQPILCAFGVAKPDECGCDSARETLVTALKQSANPWLPEIKPPMTFAAALSAGAPENGKAVFGASPASEATARQLLTPSAAAAATALWVGPEGGFSPEEESALLASGALPITLGRCVLRVETAVPALAGCLYGTAALQTESPHV